MVKWIIILTLIFAPITLLGQEAWKTSSNPIVEHEITVAKSGGQYSSIKSAIESVTGNNTTNKRKRSKGFCSIRTTRRISTSRKAG